MKKESINVIIPAFNEADNIKITYNRIKESFKKIDSLSYNLRIIFVNDGSTDFTCKIIKEICANDSDVSLISFTRNYGRPHPGMAGLELIEGDLYFLLDADCQDPPEKLNQFIEKIQDGFDIVYGIRNRINESFILFLLGKMFYRFLKFISDEPIILDMGDYVLFKKKVRDKIIKTKSVHPIIRSEIASSGYKHIGINYEREVRNIGKSSLNKYGLIKFVVETTISTSTLFLRIFSIIGLLIFIINLSLIYFHTFHNMNLISYFIFLNLGFLSLFVTIASLYIGRIYKNIIRKPRYTVDFENSVNI